MERLQSMQLNGKKKLKNMNKIEIHFHKLKADNGWLFLLMPTIGLSRCKDKFINEIAFHLVWLYWNLEIIFNLK